MAKLDCLEAVLPAVKDNVLDLRQAWARYCGYVVDGESVLTKTKTVQDYAAGILAIVGQPLSSQEIVDHFTVERNVRSLTNHLGADSRFSRVDRDRDPGSKRWRTGFGIVPGVG